MPIELYLKISKVLLDFYVKDRRKNLSSKVCEDLINALLPICQKIEDGKYDIKPTKGGDNE